MAAPPSGTVHPGASRRLRATATGAPFGPRVMAVVADKVYVELEDLEVYMKRAVELGGKTLVPAVTLSGQGSFAWLAAPEGNLIGIWKPAKASKTE